MGCDIHLVAERQDDGKWIEVPGAFFDYRDYGMFGFLAGVRNYSAIPPLAPQRGLPECFEGGDDYRVGEHSFSWLAVKELCDFDYDRPIEDRRVTVQTGPNSWNGGATAEPGGGTMTTYRAFLGPAFFVDLDRLKGAGAERIVFGFDS